MSNKQIPLFNTEDEEHEFWAIHNSTEYVDWQRAQRVVLPNLKVGRRLAFLVDNLLHRETELEDAVFAQSPEFKKLVQQVKATAQPSEDWRKELDEL